MTIKLAGFNEESLVAQLRRYDRQWCNNERDGLSHGLCTKIRKPTERHR